MTTAATLPDRENALISRLLQVSVDSQVKAPYAFLSSVTGELRSSTDKCLLTLANIDDIFIERLSMRDCSTLQTQLVLLVGYMEKCESELGRSGLAADHSSICGAILGVVQRYVSTAITCPELFNQAERSLTKSGEILLDMMGKGEMAILMVIRVCDLLATEAGIEGGIEFARPVVISLVQRIISSRSFDVCGDQTSGDVNSLALFLRMSKLSYVSRILVESPAFLPKNLPAPMKFPSSSTASTTVSHKNVFLLQTSTLIGRLLMPSTVDHVLQQGGQSIAKEVHFGNLSKRSMPDFAASVTQVRAQLAGVIDGTLSVLQPMLRADEVTRLRCLEWFALAIRNSASRSSMGWQQQNAPHGAQLAEHLGTTPQLGGSLAKFRTMTCMQSVRIGGLLSSGTCLNLAWTIFELCKPIKVLDCGGVDPLFLVSDTQLQTSLASEARLGDSERVAEVGAKHCRTEIGAFKSQIFWLAVSALHTLVLPSTKEAEMCIQVASVFHRDKKDGPMNDAYGEFHCFEAVFGHPRFVESLAHVINLILVMILKAATDRVDLTCQASNPALPSAPFESIDLRSETSLLSDAMAILPSCMMEEVVEILDFYRLLRDVGGRGRQARDLVESLDPDLFLLYLIWTLGSDRVKNPNIRGKAAKVLISLVKEARFSSRIERAVYSVRNLVPACIRVFSAVEKTKQSYYDIRMHVKFELRIPIQQLFELLLNIDEHRTALKGFVHDCRDDFYKFASQLLNDTTYLLEEGLDTLIAIRAGTSGSAEGTAGLGVEREIEEGDQNQEGQDMYRRSRHDPKEHCRQYMRMGHQTMSTLHQMCRQTCDVLVDDKVVLDQMISSCLDPSLDRLVGPKCLQLKGQKSGQYDFALFEFDPKKMLFQIIEMYVYLARRGGERVAKAISEDQRYYRPETLRKAVAIARREHLVSVEMLKEFEELVKFVNEYATQLRSAMDSVEIPDEFLDPIMAEIMVDPVLLPTSNNVMDRRHIVRIIHADDHDPFNRQPLKPADLVPQDELRGRIHAFCKQHSIPLESVE